MKRHRYLFRRKLSFDEIGRRAEAYYEELERRYNDDGPRHTLEEVEARLKKIKKWVKLPRIVKNIIQKDKIIGW